MDPDLEQACGSNPSWICETVFDLSGGNRLLAETADWLVSVFLIVIVAFVLAQIAKRYLGRAVARVVAPDTAVAARQLQRLGGDRATTYVAEPIGFNLEDPRRQARLQSISLVVGSTASVIIWSIAIIMALGEIGLDLAPLIAGAGIAGVALGFGAQSLVKDCISGLFMLLEDQYGVGDVVDLDEATGVVEKISLRTTVLRGVDGTVWHVPNGVVSRVGNKSQLWSVALIDVDVAYDCDLAAARTVILDCATQLAESDDWSAVVIEPPQLLGVEALGADGITIRVTTKVEPGAQWGLQRALREALKAALDDAGIEIPFPQRTVWVRRGSGPDTATDDAAGTSNDDPFEPGT
ncbi:MAG TPA: mechanosensitive ion channel family protein [Ilumatobacteraceae bacterium]|nr:mechanosensitive ion channel family protein [Ilumatobacteraceae bacterium]